MLRENETEGARDDSSPSVSVKEGFVFHLVTPPSFQDLLIRLLDPVQIPVQTVKNDQRPGYNYNS